ncbi:MAG: discoidin domain-containing protein [Pseudomonadota bacterium]
MNAHAWIFTRLVALAAAIGAASCEAPGKGGDGAARVIDGFRTTETWSPGASEGGAAAAANIRGEQGGGLRLAYEFPQGSGYAFIRRPIDLDLTGNFELSFRLRGDAPQSTFEVKFVDASGDNIWWRQIRGKEFPADWETVSIRRSDISFAWGPASDRTLRKIAAVEFVVVGAAGEKGVIDFDRLAIRRLPEPPVTQPAVVAAASGEQAGSPARAAVDGDARTAWRAPSGRKRPSILTLDLGYLRDFGGLTLDWAEGGAPAEVEAAFSEDKSIWSPMHVLERGSAGATYIRAGDAYGRFVRIRITPMPDRVIALAEARIEAKPFGVDDNVFLQAVADRSPRGAFPRSFSRQQSYWTIVGSPEGGRTALISEDGAVEPGPGAFSIEPFIIVDGEIKTWADSAHAQWLTDNYLPLPHVRRMGADYVLDISPHASAVAGRERTFVTRYRVVNTSDKARRFTLVLAVRPFQVNPPTQFLNIAGGASPISHIQWSGAAFTVNDDWRLYPTRKPTSVALASVISGGVPAASEDAGSPREIKAPDGFGSAYSYFDFELAPGASEEFATVALRGGAAIEPSDLTETAIARSEEAAAAEWRAALSATEIEGPFEASAITDSLKTALAHIMMTRDGAALRPGARSYARSWIRDGAMIAENLLRLGRADAATAFARWYAPYQFESGKIPCCVDARGADPVPENDSHGEFIFLVAEIYRYTKDKAFAAEMQPYVNQAAAAINTLRLSERTDAKESGERAAYFGLLPPSISHEGYSDKPAYSYWDNFWGLQGLRDAAFLAGALGDPARRSALQKDVDEFSADIAASIARLSETAGIQFIPGAADRRDFDATSTTIALTPTSVASSLPADAVAETFERAWREFLLRRDGGEAWGAYTPYEFRQVGSFLRLAHPDRAHELLNFYMRDRRPSGWNQWAEVVGRDARQPRFIGDMPHTWVASDFIRAALDLFAYEDREAQSLLIGSGVKREWLKGSGIRIRNLQTPYGALSYSAVERDGKIMISLAGGAAPPGGFFFPIAFLDGEFSVTINNEPAVLRGSAIHVAASPAEIILTPGASGAATSPSSHRPLTLAPGQSAVETTDASGRMHRLLLYLPDDVTEPGDLKKFPLLLFLHGSGERGDDISQVKIHGPPKLIDQGADMPFIVASPQLADGEQWDTDALAGLLETLLRETPADPDRVYMTGLSLGGHGTWALAAARPDLVAAIAPISGAGAPITADALKEMPIWSFHGALDDIVAPGRNISMVEAVNDAGGAARLTVYPDLGHDAWTRTYENPELYDWLLAHRRPARVK